MGFSLVWSAILSGCIFLCVLVLSHLRETRLWKSSNIPQPLGNPVFGKKKHLGARPWKQLEAWGLENGELFRLKVGSKQFVFVNSWEAVREIFDRQSVKTSAKGPWRGATRIVHRLNIAIMPYGPLWRQLRTILHQLLHPTVALSYRPSQEFEAKQLAHDLLEGGENEIIFKEQAHRMALSMILTSTYGIRVPSMADPICRRVDHIMKEFSETTTPGAFVTDLLPQLSVLPIWLQWWRPKAQRLYQNQYDLWMSLWQNLKEKVEQGAAPSCFAKYFLEADMERYNIDETQAAFLAALIEAGSDTTASALNIAIQYLAANPSVLAQANEEVSRVVGNNRSPSFEDIDQLPFILACIKEVARIRPLTRFGTAHYTTSEVTYKHYRIPPNCFVVINQGAIHNNPIYYMDPHQFNPARYLETTRSDAKTAKDHLNFGAGRRICPGVHVAENSLFIALAKLIWLFDIRPQRDVDGCELPIDISDDAYEEGANTVPKPFRVRFIPRSSIRAQKMREEWAEAKEHGFTIRDAKVNLHGVIVQKDQ